MRRSANKQYALLVVLFLWAAVSQGIFSTLAIRSQITHPPHLPLFLRDYSATIDGLQPTYPDTGIESGDDLIAIDGAPVNGRAMIANVNRSLRVGQTLQLTLRRGSSKTFTVPLTIRDETPPRIAFTYTIGVQIVLPVICLLVGFYIAFARPLDPLAWITMAMLGSFGQLAGEARIIAGLPAPWLQILSVYHTALNNTWPVWMLLFALHFPRPFPTLRNHRWAAPAICAMPFTFAVIDIYGAFMEANHLAAIHWVYLLEQNLSRTQTLLDIGYVSLFFLFLSLKRRSLSSPDARRRLRVMITGCGIALLPLIPFALGRVGLWPILPPWLAVFALMMLILFPLTMAYVIVVQRAMDVRMVVRMGLQYAVATAGIAFVRLALIVAIGIYTLRLVEQSEHRMEGIVIFSLGALAVILLRRLGNHVAAWIDRRFFREAYNAERILAELSNSVTRIRDTKRLMETVTHRIADSLHVPRIAFLLAQNDGFQPAYALGFSGDSPNVRLSASDSTIRTLQRLNAPSKIYFDDPESWVHGASDREQTVLQRLQSQVLLPVSLDSRMLAIISLGAKLSELPYSKADLQLLSAVAAQAGLALENAHLTETIRREVAQRERLDRELEIARDVQQRLFPQKLPQIQGLDFAGYCRPALGVGGDYYDFIHLPNGSLGIAIGDVSGKGIAAALMMASLQASLRGQTIKPCDTLSETIEHVNGLVYEASATNRYATFFYAQYDPNTSKLRYVNAGHNPPILRRTTEAGFEFLRLEEGGTVIGVFPKLSCKEGEMDLRPGDVLVAFTDGISEAMNDQEEEFDEARLTEAIRTSPNSSAAAISSYILEKVDAFTTGADQHDDMTLVIIRLV